MEQEILEKYSMFVRPDPSIKHFETVTPFEMCMDNIFNNDMYANYKAKLRKEKNSFFITE